MPIAFNVAFLELGRAFDLLMPYPHAVNVVGDAALDTVIDQLARLGRKVVTFDVTR